MRHYINTYINNVEALLADPDADLEKVRREQLIQINFIKHERVVHLHVTVMCCIILFISIVIYFMTKIDAVGIVVLLMLVLSFAYLTYYFFIENSTQALYCQYNRICMKLEENDPTIQKLYNELYRKPPTSKKPGIKIN